MNLKHLSDESLLHETRTCVNQEREMTVRVLHHLREVERRRLFASLGYASLFEYVTGELGYCAASACRRIDAMRLLKQMPELEEKIQEGKLTLTSVAKAQAFFKKEGFTLEAKKELMESLESKSTREVEKELLRRSHQPEVHLKERVRPVTPHLSEVRFYASEELLQDLEKLKGLLAHAHPQMSTADLISVLAKRGLKELDPGQRQVRAKKVVAAPKESARQEKGSGETPRPTSRYIPRPLMRAVWKRDQSQCTWRDPKTEKRCTSRYRLQLDHKHPHALGGEATLENLRLLCFQHNQWEAERWFGKEFMQSF